MDELLEEYRAAILWEYMASQGNDCMNMVMAEQQVLKIKSKILSFHEVEN